MNPVLGVVRDDDYEFVVADIPGLIEGAHEGKGLGLRFLRHIERNSLLLFMIPADSEDIKKEFDILLNELKQYNLLRFLIFYSLVLPRKIELFGAFFHFSVDSCASL